MAKRIVHLVNAVGAKINKDPETNEYLRLYFLPDYNVTAAETIIPAAELSQHISTAGTEASGAAPRNLLVCITLLAGQHVAYPVRPYSSTAGRHVLLCISDVVAVCSLQPRAGFFRRRQLLSKVIVNAWNRGNVERPLMNPLPPPLAGRRHLQHEVPDERLPHHRHHGRRQYRDR